MLLSSDERRDEYQDLQELICSLDSHVLWKELSRVLPLVLRLLDHHHVPNKLLGIKCIKHVLKSVGVEDLRSRGLDSLLLHSLKASLYIKDIQFLDQLIQVIILSLQVFRSKSQEFEDKLEDIFEELLSKLRICSSMNEKVVYWSHLPQFFQMLGLASVKYTKRMLELLEDQLSFAINAENESLFISAFKSFHEFLEMTAPRTPINMSRYLLLIMKCVFINLDCIQNHEVVLTELRLCVDVLKKRDESTFKKSADMFTDGIEPADVLKVKSCLICINHSD